MKKSSKKVKGAEKLQTKRIVRHATVAIEEETFPIPTITLRENVSRPVYPFNFMKVGQSFFVPGDTKKLEASLIATTRYRRTQFGEDHVIGLATRGGMRGYRVWRTV